MSHKDKRFNPAIADTFRKLTGEFFRDRRIDLGMTQADLCKCASIDQPSLSRFEAGVQNITIDKLVALAGCLRLEIQFITKDPESVPGFPQQSSN